MTKLEEGVFDQSKVINCPNCKYPLTQHQDRIFSFFCESCHTVFEVRAYK